VVAELIRIEEAMNTINLNLSSNEPVNLIADACKVNLSHKIESLRMMVIEDTENESRHEFESRISELAGIVNLGWNDQAKAVSKFNSELMSVSHRCFPILKSLGDESLFEFLRLEKIFSNPKLQESIMWTYGLKFKEDLSELPKRSHAHYAEIQGLIYLSQYGEFAGRLSRTSNVAFRQSLEFKLLVWGFQQFGITEIKRLPDFQTWFVPSDEFLSSYATVPLIKADSYADLDSNQVWGMVEFVLGYLRGDSTLSDRQHDAIVLIISSLYAITKEELFFMPLLAEFPDTRTSLMGYNSTLVFDYAPDLFIDAKTVNPMFSVFICLSSVAVGYVGAEQSEYIENSIWVMVIHYLAHLDEVSAQYKNLVKHQSLIQEIEGRGLVELFAKYQEINEKLVAELERKSKDLPSELREIPANLDSSVKALAAAVSSRDKKVAIAQKIKSTGALGMSQQFMEDSIEATRFLKKQTGIARNALDHGDVDSAYSLLAEISDSTRFECR
jgi:hypothetical protein